MVKHRELIIVVMEKLLKVADVFSAITGPRYKTEGAYSGEEFRESILYPKLDSAIKGGYVLVVNLDGTEGYGTSFLEESFGGLIRVNRMPLDEIKAHLHIVSTEEPYLISDIEEYLNDASEQEA